MKIGLFIPTVGAGGAERVFSLMANYYAQKGYEVVLFSLDDPANKPFFEMDSRVQYCPMPLLNKQQSYFKRAIRTIRQVLKVKNTIKAHKPDMLIAQLDIAIFLTLTTKILLNQKVIVYEGNNPYLNKTNKYLQKFNDFLYRFADQIVLQTHQIALTFPEHLKNKITVIYNPITEPETQIQEGSYKSNLKNKRIVGVGRLEYQKGFDVLIRAFELFAKSHPEWELTLLGEGDERPEIERQVEALDLERKVHLPGRVKNTFGILQKSSVFVLSSRFEGLPNALCEAMFIGLPVISTRCKFGPEEIINNYENGILVPVEDATALRNTLEELVHDFSLYQKIGMNAKNLIQKCGVPTVMEQWEQLIHRLVNQK